MNNPDRKRRPLPKSEQLNIFTRDGWLCRWCRKPVIFAPVMKLIEREVRQAGVIGKLAYYHSHWTRQSAPLLDELGAGIDHVEAFSTGGTDSIENMVTACNKCNGQKSAAGSLKWDEKRPRKFVKGKYGEPMHWDGLASLFLQLAQKDTRGLTVSERQWTAAIQGAIGKSDGGSR